MTDILTPSTHERDTSALDLRLVDSAVIPSLPPAKINAKTTGGTLYNTIRGRGSGCFKLNTLPDDLKKFNITRRNSTTEPPQAFPTIKELAQLSQHAYKISDLKKEDKIPFEIGKKSDWICIGTGRYSDGYCGAAYVNHKYSHVVIAHGGTEFNFKKLKELYRDVVKTDIGGVFLNKNVSQISSAYIFTKIVVNLCSDTQFSISVTGHSLGGWLAQLCAFYIVHPNYISQNEEVQKIIEDKQKNLEIPEQYVKMNEPYHLHTVSFDSPGCRQALKKIVGYYGIKAIEWRENVGTLDLTVIIAPSNSVNTCGEHVGYILELEMKGIPSVSWIIESHGIKNFVDHLSVDQPKLREVHNVYWWKPVQSAVESVILDQWYLGRETSCQLNIFSPNEFVFLTRTQAILKWIYHESLPSSEKNIFEEKRHEGARKILDDIKFINDFILNFRVTHNVIEFPKNYLDERKIDMSELIWKLVRLLRQNRVWWNGRDESIRNVIRDMPRCREMVCESEGSLYVEEIPKLRSCMTENLCNTVRLFLANDQNFRSINASSGGKSCRSRLYMVHLFHCKNTFGNHVLFLNILSIQRLSREIDMKNVFSDTKYELIVVECDSEISEEINNVISGMIANAKAKNKKLITVTSGESSLAVQNFDMTFQFQNLDDESKQFISQCPVHIHGNTFKLGMLSQPDTMINLCSFFKSISVASEFICDIFDGKNIDLSGGSLPIMAQHYIPRTLYQITLDVGKLKEKLEDKDFSDVIVVSNSDMPIVEHFPALIPLSNKNLIHEPVGEYTKLDFLIVCEREYKSQNVHWFKMEGSVFVWQMSSGQPCFDYLNDSNDEGGISDSKPHELHSNFIILADEPGMGKSAAITKLFLEYKPTDSHFNWPVYINLNHHQVDLKTTDYSYDSTVNCLAKAMNLDDEFKKSLFRFCLEKMGNVTFFIDSFDEISQKGQDFVVQMLEHLKGMKHSEIRVWIATRNYAKFELEKRLRTKSYRFHRVEEPAQIKFLVNNWTHTVPIEQKKNYNRIKTFAEAFADRAVKEIRKALGEDHTFIGIPLQLVFLALIYNDKFLQLLEHKLGDGVRGMALSLSDDDWEKYSVKFSSTLELYNLFVDKKLNIWLADKFKFDTRTDSMEGTLKARMNEIHSQAAFLHLYSSIITNWDIKVKALSPEDSSEVNRVGFCETSSLSKTNFRFYHQTIAEYFTAKYLVDLIIKNQNNGVFSFLRNNYHQPNFKKIRYFLDSLLCKRIPVLENLDLLDRKNISCDVESLRERLTGKDWGRVDALGRNILHYAMAYGDHHSGIFWMIAKDLRLFHKRDRLGETCLSYLSLSENFPQLHPPDFNKYLEYKSKEMGTKLETNEVGSIARIIELPVLYSIFCSQQFRMWLKKVCETRWNESSGESSYVSLDDQQKNLPVSVSVNHANSGLKEINLDKALMGLPDDEFKNGEIFIDFMKTAQECLLTQNVKINLAWYTHLRANGMEENIYEFLSTLCIHQSLDKNSKLLYLKEWFKALSDCMDGSELGAALIHTCSTSELQRVCTHNSKT